MRVHCLGSPGYPHCRIALSWLDVILTRWSCWGISQINTHKPFQDFTSLKYSCWKKKKVVSSLNSAWPWQTFTLSWAKAIRPLHIWETFWLTEYSWRSNVWTMTLPESQCPWPLTKKPLHKASTNPNGWDGNTQVTHYFIEMQVNLPLWDALQHSCKGQNPATIATPVGSAAATARTAFICTVLDGTLGHVCRIHSNSFLYRRK